jgi:hypothetical protein
MMVPSGNFLGYRPRFLDGRPMRPLQPVRCNIKRVRAADAVEAIAVEVFRQCECSGQPVTMSVINRALNQLRAHRPACRCGLCGETVAKARPDRVFVTASIWQRSTAASRARMTRSGTHG